MDLYWVSPTGGRERRVAATGVPLLDAGTIWFRGLGVQPWSPDGERLLYPRQDESGGIAVWMVDLRTGESRRVTEPPVGSIDLGATWSRDGRRVIFDRTDGGQSTLYLVPDVDAATPRARRLSQEGMNDFGAAWLPDGSGVAFVSSRSGAVAPWVGTLEAPADARPLPSPARWVYHLAVSSRGDVAMATAEHRADLYVGSPEAPSEEHRNVTRSTTNSFGAVFRGRDELVYHGDRAGNYDIWSLPVDGGEPVPLTEHPALDVMPDLSPGGDLVFASDREGPLRPWILPAGAPEPTLLLDRALSMPCDALAVYCRGPRWSPDGALVGLVLAGRDGPELWTVRPDGSDARRVEVTGLLSFDWYRDGSRLVYVRNSADGEEREVRVRQLETGADTLLLAGAWGEPSVSPSGRRMSLLNSRSHYEMDAAEVVLTPPGPDGLPRVAEGPRPLTEGRGAWHTHNLAWSDDETLIAYTRDTDTGDLYLLELPADR